MVLLFQRQQLKALRLVVSSSQSSSVALQSTSSQRVGTASFFFRLICMQGIFSDLPPATLKSALGGTQWVPIGSISTPIPAGNTPLCSFFWPARPVINLTPVTSRNIRASLHFFDLLPDLNLCWMLSQANQLIVVVTLQ